MSQLRAAREPVINTLTYISIRFHVCNLDFSMPFCPHVSGLHNTLLNFLSLLGKIGIGNLVSCLSSHLPQFVPFCAQSLIRVFALDGLYLYESLVSCFLGTSFHLSLPFHLYWQSFWFVSWVNHFGSLHGSSTLAHSVGCPHGFGHVCWLF